MQVKFNFPLHFLRDGFTATVSSKGEKVEGGKDYILPGSTNKQ